MWKLPKKQEIDTFFKGKDSEDFVIVGYRGILVRGITFFDLLSLGDKCGAQKLQ
jgi:hypothetical protein